ncbi:simple sugar transport system permease protein [Kandleria vitulina]|uniref:Simple sugar transport system permease protein n=1 Tax=Kandleria vitulina TaxID=1630 RepID=A0A1H2TNP5_9FIRM|nr:ABC transporter permease [Kandleria vitulina]SDW45375.1 simple sugar transport system permease protein [Kandleria vitulina]HBG67112.1 ABC transporter permease [Kandleria vitulina]HCY53680.1 ABC transporter permease [Kandleria vitulina]
MKNKSAGFFEKDSTKSVISSLIAILIGLLVGLVIILIANPADALEGFLIMLTGGFQEGMLSLGDVLAYSVPVMMTGLSIAFAYKTGEFNIGVPGQYYVGAFVALLIGVKATFLPDAIAWLIAIICGGLAGALWAFVPGILKAKRNVNVVISGIMMNYVGLLLVIRGVKTFIYESTGAQSLTVSTERAIPKFGLDVIFEGSSINFGFVIAVALCIVAWIIMNKTTFGYELKATGFNKDAAKYAGMNETKAVIMSLVIAGLFAGVGGAIAYLGGTGKAIQISEVLPPEGFNGIPVALLGFSNPIGCIFASLFIAYINVGGNYMQSLNIAIEVIDIIVAVIVYFASFTLFIKLMLDKFRRSKKHKTLATKEGGNK